MYKLNEFLPEFSALVIEDVLINVKMNAHDDDMKKILSFIDRYIGQESDGVSWEYFDKRNAVFQAFKKFVEYIHPSVEE